MIKKSASVFGIGSMQTVRQMPSTIPQAPLSAKEVPVEQRLFSGCFVKSQRHATVTGSFCHVVADELHCMQFSSNSHSKRFIIDITIIIVAVGCIPNI